MSTIAVKGTNVSVIQSAFSWQSYWKQQSEVLFFAWDSTDILNKVVGGQLPNQKVGATDYLTVTGSGLNSRYRTPNTTAYKNADTDYAFWKTDGSESTCDGNRLIGYDFSHIIIKYGNASPYTITAIMILSSTINPGSAKENQMISNFQLSYFWSGTFNENGYPKENRTEQSLWTPESIIPSNLILTLISGGVKIDWTLNSTTAQTEIWGKSDSDSYTLLYTINAGIATKNDNGVTPVDLRYYKLRAKYGSFYSNFTSEVNIAMLSVDLLLGYGNFSNSAYWSCGVSWTITGGTCNFDNITASKFLSNLVYFIPAFTINKTYKIKFTISNANTLASFALVDKDTTTLFSSPYNAIKTFVNGDYDFNSICTKTTTHIGMYANLVQSAFSVDNFSIKEILMP